jgi:streptogramin lyase
MLAIPGKVSDRARVRAERRPRQVFGVVVSARGGMGLLAACASALIWAHGALGAKRPSPGRAVAHASSATPSAFSKFTVHNPKSAPEWITPGPGGDLWFTERFSHNIGRITPSGKIKEFAIRGYATAITAGPDGNVWFAEREANEIGRITPSGKITEFVIPTPNSVPNGITTGPDGNLWLTQGAGKVARITPGGSITEFQVPTAKGVPGGIAAGPDGNVWFAEGAADKIARVTPAGAITEFQVPFPGYPGGITAGPGGDLWFTEAVSSKIGRITPAGAISEFAVPPTRERPTGLTGGITASSDGDVWFTEAGANKIGRITPSGTVTAFTVPGEEESAPHGIAATPNGDLWFPESVAVAIGWLRPQLLPGPVRCVVPKLKGKTLAESRRLLTQAHCGLGGVTGPKASKRKLVVVAQTPAAKQVLPSGAKVSVRLG